MMDTVNTSLVNMSITARQQISKKRKRVFHRVISGLHKTGKVRFLTLTSGLESPNLSDSWRKLYMQLKRRNVLAEYVKVNEFTQSGLLHSHILFRGRYIDQKLISRMWSTIHNAEVVDIRLVKGKAARVAGYVAKYMGKDATGRMSYSWGWVWRGFCKSWHDWKAICNLSHKEFKFMVMYWARLCRDSIIEPALIAGNRWRLI